MRQLAPGFMGSLLLFVMACGGKVVVESANTGGAGGTSTSSNGDGGFIASTGDVSPVGVVSAVGVTSASTGGASLCEQVCAKQQADGCGSPSCVSECQKTYANAGMCTPQLDAIVKCLLTTGDSTCNMPSECALELQSYQACMAPPPMMCNGTTSCSVTNDGSCDCQTDCNGSTLEVQCTPGNATDFCLCIKNGMPIDKCPQPQGNGLSCDIVKGCCAKAFFP